MPTSRRFPSSPVSGFIVGSIAAIWALSTSVLADGDQSYTALRDWIDAAPALDNITPGQHLSAADREALETVIPRSAWKYYIFDDMDMEIAATAHYPAPPDWGKNLSGDYQLDDQGVLINFQGGGFPFEEINADDPMAGQKVIWNMLWRPGENDFVMPMVTWMRSENGVLDRKLEYTSVNSTYSLGDDQCLVAGYEEVKDKRVMEFRSPRDMAGAKDLSISYVDHYKENSGWMYVPAQRKPRRTLASERTSELMGMDMIREDMNGFGGKVHENNWTYLGKRKVVATINIADNPEFGGPHLWVPNKARWEVRDTHVVLIQPKTNNHPYSSRIVFVDAETWWTHWMFAFDQRDDELLRMNQHFLKYSESYAHETPQQAPYIEQDYAKNVGHKVFLHLGESDINAKKPHATLTHCYVTKRVFSPARAKQFYSLRNMNSGRR
ncbi:MAG: DUF1329 domain-containing protein [Proteobacteria bacterium]|nr:DUF1329 domain-containing protein [Pseudomonadota bacterium]